VRGTGRSRRAAEQSAAKLALESAQAAMQALRRSKRKAAGETQTASSEPAATTAQAPEGAEAPAPGDATIVRG
jgi:type II secretory pathway pseudopilin PulG